MVVPKDVESWSGNGAYWSALDESMWQSLLRENPFLERLSLRGSEYGPPRGAPWSRNDNQIPCFE